MKIAIDIDEVVVECVEKYMKFVGEMGFKKVDYNDVSSYDLWKVLGIGKDLMRELFDKYNSSDHFNNVDFVDGSKEGVCFLKNRYDIYFITARPKSICKDTRDFIFKEFGILGNRVVFSGDTLNEGRAKDEICRELGADVIIEDNGASSLIYAEGGLLVLLLDKPWNQNIEHKNIFRCFCWDDILNKIEELKNV